MSKYSLRLFGVLALTGADGQDRTPRMAKTQALLAFLAVARGAPVNRARLQDLLWSDRGLQQARDSLRQALSKLRRCFGDDIPCPIETEGGPIRLSLEHITVDLFEDATPPADALYRPQFLEGISIRDGAFNLWLAEMRDRLGAPPDLPRVAPVIRAAAEAGPALTSPVFEIGFLPARLDAAGGKAARIAQLYLDHLAEVMEQSAIVRVYDFRWQRDAPLANLRGPDVFLNLAAAAMGDEVCLSTSFLHPGSGRTVFTTAARVRMDDLSPLWLSRQTAAVFDQLCEKLVRFDAFGQEEHAAARKVFTAIDHAFRLSHSDIDLAGNLLDEACEMVESSTVYAWNAFLTAFRVEKLGRSGRPDLLERADDLAHRALALDQHNPLTSALVAHVYGFVLRDKDRAAEILMPMRDHSAKVPMLADSLAMHHFYTGDFRAARAYAAEAVQTGQFNPFRYSFTTSLAMSSLMCGDFGPAIAQCKSALAQHPVRGGHLYEPTLRTLAAAAGLQGEIETGRSAYRLLAEQGDYSPLQRLSDSDAPFPNEDVRALVKQGMEELNVRQ